VEGWALRATAEVGYTVCLMKVLIYVWNYLILISRCHASSADWITVNLLPAEP
jgi:hypothetical protein